MTIHNPEPKQVKPPIKNRVETLLKLMTLAEKIGQMTQVDIRGIQPAEVSRWSIGSVLSGGGCNPTPNNPQTWAQMVSIYQEAALLSRLRIPLIYGADAVHGHNNVVGATIFPHNIGLGATRDPELAERIGRATALEMSATGVFWNFAPCIAVPRDIRWGRTYEGFSEETDLVSALGAASVTGLQGDLGSPGTVIACAKHFVADGGTTWGTTGHYEWLSANWQFADQRYRIDQGDTQLGEATLRKIHLAPYGPAIEAGARSIMVSLSGWNGTKMHAQHHLLTDVLKGELGFSGFLVSDWHAIEQISADYYQCVVLSINAGLDMIMVPFEYQTFINTLEQAVQAGDVSSQRIDDAVRRILTVKFELGLFERNAEDEPGPEILGNDAHRHLAREAVRKSLVLLKNDNEALPIAKDCSAMVVAGSGASNMGIQCGGWTIEWLGDSGDITPGTTLLQAIRHTVATGTTIHYDESGRFAEDLKVEVGIACLHELPYAEGVGDRADLSLNEKEICLLKRVGAHCRRLVVIIFSGRPLIITDQLPLADAWVAAWLPGSEGQGISDVLFGDYPPLGKLPFTWPRSMSQIPLQSEGQSSGTGGKPLFPFNHGLAI